MAASGRPPARGWMLLAIVAAGALWWGTLLTPPLGGHERELLRVLRPPALGLLGLLAASWIVSSALRARRSDLTLASITEEEPLDVPPDLMSCHGGSPVVVLVGLEQGAGVTTLAFNLAVSLALHGTEPGTEIERAARPICLLAEGPLTAALGLDPQPLAELIARRPYRLGPEVVDLALRHASGCEMLCLAPAGEAVQSMRPLVSELGRHYDAVLVDGGCGGPAIVDISVDVAESLLLVALPTAGSVTAAGRWIEWVYSHTVEFKTALLLNHVRDWPPAPLELHLAFPHHAQLPEEPGVAVFDQRGLPWAADARLRSARTLTAATHQLFSMRNVR